MSTSLTLIFLRHGAYNDDPRIAVNALTEKGREQIRRTSEKIGRILGHQTGGIQIMSSPLLRTKQSAEIVRDILDASAAISIQKLLGPDIEDHRDHRDFFQTSLMVLPSHVQTVIAATHQPTIQAYTQSLMGTVISLKVAEALVLKFDGENWGQPGQAYIQNKLEPKPLALT